MKQAKFNLIEESKKKSQSIMTQCACGFYDFVVLPELSSGKKRGCGVCVFNMPFQEAERLYQAKRMPDDKRNQLVIG